MKPQVTHIIYFHGYGEMSNPDCSSKYNELDYHRKFEENQISSISICRNTIHMTYCVEVFKVIEKHHVQLQLQQWYHLLNKTVYSLQLSLFSVEHTNCLFHLK